MDLKKLIGQNVLEIPEDLKPVLIALETGELKSLVILGEYQDGSVATSWNFGMNGGASNLYALVGALESLKFDLLAEIAFGSAAEDEEDDE